MDNDNDDGKQEFVEDDGLSDSGEIEIADNHETTDNHSHPASESSDDCDDIPLSNDYVASDQSMEEIPFPFNNEMCVHAPTILCCIFLGL